MAKDPILFLDENLIICQGSREGMREFARIVQNTLQKRYPDMIVLYSGQCDVTSLPKPHIGNTNCDKPEIRYGGKSVTDLYEGEFYKKSGDLASDARKVVDACSRTAQGAKDPNRAFENCMKAEEPGRGELLKSLKVPPLQSRDFDIKTWVEKNEDSGRPVILLSHDSDRDLEVKELGDRIVIPGNIKGICTQPEAFARQLINRIEGLARRLDS